MYYIYYYDLLHIVTIGTNTYLYEMTLGAINNFVVIVAANYYIITIRSYTSTRFLLSSLLLLILCSLHLNFIYFNYNTQVDNYNTTIINLF